jgi:hypothetical protein
MPTVISVTYSGDINEWFDSRIIEVLAECSIEPNEIGHAWGTRHIQAFTEMAYAEMAQRKLRKFRKLDIVLVPMPEEKAC